MATLPAPEVLVGVAVVHQIVLIGPDKPELLIKVTQVVTVLLELHKMKPVAVAVVQVRLDLARQVQPQVMVETAFNLR
jgi:hypothetical protein